MTNPYLAMSAAEREKQLALMNAAMKADKAVENIAAAAALKWAVKVLAANEALPDVFKGIKQQAFPREALLARPAELSESQTQGIVDKVTKALEAVKL